MQNFFSQYRNKGTNGEMNKNLVIFVVILVLCLVIYYCFKSYREGYANVILSSIPDTSFVTRPEFKAREAPRFDPTKNGGYIHGPMPSTDYQGSPLDPLDDNFGDGAHTPDYNSGMIENFSSLSSQFVNKNTPSEYKKLSSVDAPEIRKRESNSSRPTLEYTDPQELLPTPDASFLTADGSRDPSDPSTYVYDRYLFAKLKPRNSKNVGDSALYIRGDLPIKPLNLGWFVPASTPSVDLMAGSISQIADIDTSIDLQDVAIENKLTEEKLNKLSSGLPSETKNLGNWGKLWD